MFCCAKKSKSKINPQPLLKDDGNLRHKSHEDINLLVVNGPKQEENKEGSPNIHQKKEMFSRQSPHFSSVDITKKKPVQADHFKEKTRIHCRFCGGKTCKHENWTLCDKPAIKGLHSNWINSNIIASQRLSDRLINEYDIIKQFKEKGVTAIFNLQEPGEHPFCGDGIIPKIGFSYTPELLMNNGIGFFNFYWKDLTNPTFERCLNIAQVMDFIIKNGGKVLVHCHAGQGRTALVIGAYLYYAREAKTYEEAIKLTRANRPKCFSKGYNQKFMKMFATELSKIRVLFPAPKNPQTLQSILEKQNLLLHGEERRFNKFLPKVVDRALSQLKKVIEFKMPQASVLNEMKKPSHHVTQQVNQIREHINNGSWNEIDLCDDVPVLVEIIFEFIKCLDKYIISDYQLKIIQSQNSDITQLESSLLGFLTVLSDFASTLIQIHSNSQQSIYEQIALLLLQGRSEYKDALMTQLESLTKRKEQIYRDEDKKEEESLSPVREQVLKSQDAFFYNQSFKLHNMKESSSAVTGVNSTATKSNLDIDQRLGGSESEKNIQEFK